MQQRTRTIITWFSKAIIDRSLDKYNLCNWLLTHANRLQHVLIHFPVKIRDIRDLLLTYWKCRSTMAVHEFVCCSIQFLEPMFLAICIIIARKILQYL